MVKIWCTFTKAIEKISQGCHLFWTTLQSYTYDGRPIDSCIYIYIYMIYRTCQFQWPWTTPTPGFKVTPFFNAEYLRNGTRYRQFQCNTNKDLHTPYNDTKRRAVSLRRLSFLFKIRQFSCFSKASTNTKFVVTTSVLSSSKCTKIRFRPKLRPKLLRSPKPPTNLHFFVP